MSGDWSIKLVGGPRDGETHVSTYLGTCWQCKVRDDTNPFRFRTITYKYTSIDGDRSEVIAEFVE